MSVTKASLLRRAARCVGHSGLVRDVYDDYVSEPVERGRASDAIGLVYDQRRLRQWLRPVFYGRYPERAGRVVLAVRAVLLAQ